MYLSGSTLYIGGVPAVQKDPNTGQITLPANSRIKKTDGTTASLDPTSVTQEDIDLALYLEDLLNIDITNLQDGSLLQYNSSTSKWEATNLIETAGLTINGGAF